MKDKNIINLEFKQLVKEFKNEVTDKSIKKPFCFTLLSISIDSEMNYIILQIINPLFKEKEKETEIGLIHFGVKNTPTKKLSELIGTEINHILTESMRICVDRVNETLLNNFPNANKIKYVQHQSLIDEWNRIVTNSKKDFARLN